MRSEKKFLTSEYIARLNGSPFVIVVDYRGLKVLQFTELRKRLHKAGAEVHVVKNSVFRIAAKEAGIADLTGVLAGQLAAVTGQKDISAAAKAIKTFSAEFDKPKVQFGFLGNQRLSKEDIQVLADLPSIETLRAQFMGVLMEPATSLARLLNTPATQLARVLQARVEKEQAETLSPQA
jgi:large subunit ribosomal protein L10